MSRNRPTLAGAQLPPTATGSSTRTDRVDSSRETTVCPRCGESVALAKVKGCVQCLACHFKFDCNGW